MSIIFLTVSVIYFWKTSVFNLLLFYKRLLQYSMLSGLDRCCTCNFTLIKSCLTMFIITIDMAPWSFLINYSLSLSLCLSLSHSLKYCVQVFPCVRTLEDGAQVAHPVIFPDNQVFLFFYCFNCHNSEKSKLGVFRVLKFCYMVSHPTFCCFFQFCLWFMVSPVSFQVGCRSYIPFVVYFAYNDINSVWAWTGNMLLYGPMSNVPRRYKNSGFFWMATCVAPFFAREKNCSVLGGHAGHISVEQ